jgi:hypothetical protein
MKYGRISRNLGEDRRGTETKTRHVLVGYMTTSSWRTLNSLQIRFELCWAITLRVLIIPYRRFGTTCRSHFKGKDRPLPLKIGPVGCPETSVSNYHYSLRNKPQERSSHLLRGGSLKSRIVYRWPVTQHITTVFKFTPHVCKDGGFNCSHSSWYLLS